jgi:hypothetical protein
MFDGVATMALRSWAVPEIVEAYRDFEPRCNARTTVEDLLTAVPREHLKRLGSVVLTNSAALTGGRKRSWSWSRGRKARHADVAGLYHCGHKGQDAWIELFVDRIVAGPPAWLLRIRFVRTMFFGPVLFHEIGHHIHARMRPEHREREDVADDWAQRLGRQYLRERHAAIRTILWPVFRVGRFLRARQAPRPAR